MDLSRRSDAPELMDDADLDNAEYARCLRDLAAVNRLTATHRPTLAWLDRAVQTLPPDTPVSILDVASGHGDLLRAIRRWADRRGITARLEGIDLNPRSAREAAAATDPALEITWRTGDVFAYTPQPPPDFIVSSQFAHHLDDAGVARFLRWLDQHAAHGWLITDLHRHALAYYGFPLLARAMFWHRIVRLDGTVSIARSFRRGDWVGYLENAKLAADIAWRLPFRWSVGHLK